MNQYLKSYQISMLTVGPVFIGSGKEIGKKEYIFLNKKQIGIPDMQKLYAELTRQRKQAAFEDYLLGTANIGLSNWLLKENIKLSSLQPFLKYTLDCGDAVNESNPNKLQVMDAIKDAYGKPYIPGISLKGMFRTILLSADIIHAPDKYRTVQNTLLQSADRKTGRTNYLSKETQNIENICYCNLKRPDTKPTDAVNDIMQGFIISDSEPLSIDDLVLCQKIELHTNETETKLPLLRECIKPNTEIRFTITIDTSICNITGKSLMTAVKQFIQNYYNNFAKAFPNVPPPKTNYVICGGGSGFVSKTIIYPMFGKNNGTNLTQKIFEKTMAPKIYNMHKHSRDNTLGVSPHIMKCTRYQEKLLQMGMCKIVKVIAMP